MFCVIGPRSKENICTGKFSRKAQKFVFSRGKRTKIVPAVNYFSNLFFWCLNMHINIKEIHMGVPLWMSCRFYECTLDWNCTVNALLFLISRLETTRMLIWPASTSCFYNRATGNISMSQPLSSSSLRVGHFRKENRIKWIHVKSLKTLITQTTLYLLQYILFGAVNTRSGENKNLYFSWFSQMQS